MSPVFRMDLPIPLAQRFVSKVFLIKSHKVDRINHGDVQLNRVLIID